MPCFREAGQRLADRAADLPVLHPDSDRSACRRRTSGCRTTRTTEQTILGDFKRLWATNFLDDLSIEVHDYRSRNGVIGKLVIYNMEERQRVKIVDYNGHQEDRADEDRREAASELSITIRLDTFIDPAPIRKVAGVVREMMAEKGYQDAEVDAEIKAIAGGPKLVHLTFTITEGPKVKIRTSTSSATRRSATASSRRR